MMPGPRRKSSRGSIAAHSAKPEMLRPLARVSDMRTAHPRRTRASGLSGAARRDPVVLCGGDKSTQRKRHRARKTARSRTGGLMRIDDGQSQLTQPNSSITPTQLRSVSPRRSATEMPHSLRGRSERPAVAMAGPKWRERLVCLKRTCTDRPVRRPGLNFTQSRAASTPSG